MENFFEKKLDSLNLVIFDLDGTLIDSNGVHNELDIELVRTFGETKNSEEILKERDEILKNNKTGDIYLNYCGFLKIKYNLDLSKEEILQYRRDLSKKFAMNIKYKPDADRFIIYVNENENMRNKCNLEKYFDYIVTKDDVKLKKPNPEVYNKIINKFKIEDSSKCLVVEDSLTGVMAAKNANLDVIVVYDKYADKDREKLNEMANYNVKSFKELIDIFEESKKD